MRVKTGFENNKPLHLHISALVRSSDLTENIPDSQSNVTD